MALKLDEFAFQKSKNVWKTQEMWVELQEKIMMNEVNEESEESSN